MAATRIAARRFESYQAQEKEYDMRTFLPAITILSLGLALTACARQDVSTQESAIPSAATLSPSTSKSPYVYDFSMINDDPGTKLHVRNTLKGQCTANNLPDLDLDPHQSWSGKLDTLNNAGSYGGCGWMDKTQVMQFWYGPDKIDSSNFIELTYTTRWSTRLTGLPWIVTKTGGTGAFANVRGLAAPVKTHCQIHRDGRIVCAVGNT